MPVNNVIVDNAKVMAKGQITLPKDVRHFLGIDTGDRVTLVCRGNQVTMMNSAVYAMKVLHDNMSGEFEKAGFSSDDDVVDYVREVRAEIEGL